MIRVSLALLGALLSSAAAAQPDPIANVPRSPFVDAAMDPAWRTLRPLSMTAEPGLRMFAVDRKGTFNGRRLAYTASMEETIVREGGKVVVSLFNTAYVVKNERNLAKRPILVMFNGGPGASSGPVHFAGAWGPRKFQSGLVKDSGDPANVMVDNAVSPLDAMDLIFLDPPDTGFSRTAPGEANKFRAVDTDSEAVSQFVVSWLKTHHRLDSPLYLAGESYGSMRVIAMARDILRIEPKVNLGGVVLMGSCPTYGQYGRTPNPAFTAASAAMMASVAYHYGKIDNKGQTWEQAVQKARDFGRKEWLPALVAGHDLSQAEFDHIVTSLPAIIGIPESYFRSNRTIAVADFNRELLRGEGLVLDRSNGLENSPDGKGLDVPALSKRAGTYFANELKVQGLGEYWYKTPDIQGASAWNLTTSGAPSLDVTLVTLLKNHPSLRVLALQGRQDTLTDIGRTEYVFAQTDFPRERFTYALYDGGHLTANTAESRKALLDFITKR